MQQLPATAWAGPEREVGWLGAAGEGRPSPCGTIRAAPGRHARAPGRPRWPQTLSKEVTRQTGPEPGQGRARAPSGGEGGDESTACRPPGGPAPSAPQPRGHLVLPGRVAPQRLAPRRDPERPVGQLRRRRLLLPPPAAHPPARGPDRKGRGRVRGRGVTTRTANETPRVGPGAARRLGQKSLRPKRPARRRGGRSHARGASSRPRTCARSQSAGAKPCVRSLASASTRASGGSDVTAWQARGTVRGKGQTCWHLTVRGRSWAGAGDGGRQGLAHPQAGYRVTSMVLTLGPFLAQCWGPGWRFGGPLWRGEPSLSRPSLPRCSCVYFGKGCGFGQHAQ